MTKILDIVDMQGDFVSGILAVPGAGKLVTKINDFFKAVPSGVYNVALFKHDTHFAGEYKHSPEAAFFPLHCEYDTPGWALVIDPSLLDTKTRNYFMTKNTFDMWESNPLPKRKKLTFKSGDEKRAYANLYRVTNDSRALRPGILRSEFMKSLGLGTKPLQVTLLGVASNFCDDDAMFGYLERGAEVTVLEDLVAGLITTAPGRAASGDIRDVIALPRYKTYVDSGKLRLITSAHYLQGLKP